MSTLLILFSLVLAIGLLWLVVYLDSRPHVRAHIEAERKRVEYGRSKFASLQERKQFGMGDYQAATLARFAQLQGQMAAAHHSDEISRLFGRGVQ